nr:SEC-C metal-binding domain-containing protein [Streptococcus sp.]
MVDAQADWLYGLPQWEEIFDADKRSTLYREARNARTVHVGKKIGRNDPCPCGSGKKYKFCHGKKGAEPLPVQE